MTVTTRRTDYRTAAAELVRRLREIAARGEPFDREIIRLEIELERFDPLAWLQERVQAVKLYWRSRDGRLEIAGAGSADTIISDRPEFDAIDRVTRNLAAQKSDHTRYFGGFRFDPGYPPEAREPRWRDFGSGRFVLPRFELRRRDDRYSLACNLHRRDLDPDRIPRILSELERSINPTTDNTSALPTPQARHDQPDHERWLAEVRGALDRFRSGEVQKLVLARKSEIEFGEAVNPWRLLERLRETTANCFLFGLQPGEGGTFIGASPERLYRRTDDRIRTEAVAGTRPRGSDTAKDTELERELTLSTKDREEHRLVIDGLREGLERICAESWLDDLTGAMKLAGLQHLVTRLEGRLRPAVSDQEILKTLHPSPAVGGYPAPAAPQALRTAEPFDRGWYAGPIGWIGRDAAEFAVAIRSALVCGNRLDLFAGAGLVPESDPEAEWAEVESKITPFLDLIQGGTV